MITRITSSLIVIIALGFMTGCVQISATQASLESSSDSSSSPFKSSSKSSSGSDEKGGKEETAYQRDVRHYTVEFARSAGNIESFQRDLSAIAEGYGITDWERTEDTYVAVGRGLAESELDDWGAKRLAVALSNEDHDHLALVRSGYESRRAR